MRNQIKETKGMSGEPLPRTSLEPVCDALAHVIRKHRKARKLSMNGLAKRTRLTRQAISHLENRRRVPTVDTVARICRAFGVSAGMVWFEAEGCLRPARCARGCN